MLAYQVNSTHLEHLLAKSDDCSVCISEKQTESASHQISFVADTTPLETTETKREIVREKITTISPQPSIKLIDFSGMRQYQVDKIPIGYSSHAPPYSYS
jgi:hypothetical protein